MSILLVGGGEVSLVAVVGGSSFACRTVELDVVRDRAALAGMALGAWIGQVAVDAAGGRQQGQLRDLLRLHADVLALVGEGPDEARRALLVRLESAIDELVAGRAAPQS